MTATTLRASVLALATAALSAVPTTAIAQNVDSLRTEIRRLGQSGEFSGVVLLRQGGRTVLHEAAGLASIAYQAPNRTDTRFNLASVGKMFTAVAIGQLVEQGKLKWTDTLSRVLPDYPNRDQASRITIHQLLTHTSGMGLYWDALFRGPWTSVRTVNDLVPYFVNDSLVFAPGGGWFYSNTGFAVLAMVIEKVSGEDYFDYLQKHIFDPVGMTGTDYAALDEDIPNKATGYYRDEQTGQRKNNLFTHTVRGGGAGGGWSTSADLAAFAEAYMSGRLVSRSVLATMTTGYARMPSAPGGPPVSYGYGVMIRSAPSGVTWGHTGGFPGILTVLTMAPGTGNVMVLQSNDDGPAAVKIWQALQRML